MGNQIVHQYKEYTFPYNIKAFDVTLKFDYIGPLYKAPIYEYARPRYPQSVRGLFLSVIKLLSGFFGYISSK